MPVNTEKTLLLHAMLPHVAFDGWSADALERGAQDGGLDAAQVKRRFPNGAADALECFMNELDERMLAQLQSLPLAEMKLPAKVEAAVMARLHAAEPHREAVRKALAYYAFPLNADAGLKRLYATADAIWRAVGDHPTDFSFYTKRLSLALIYSSTLLFWLDDYSENAEETRAFLQRRMGDLFRFHSWKKKLTAPFETKAQEG